MNPVEILFRLKNKVDAELKAAENRDRALELYCASTILVGAILWLRSEERTALCGE